MTIFGNLTTEGLEEASDRLGGFQVLESGAYTGTIKAAYAGKSSGGAQYVALILDCKGTEYRETFYVTNKEGKNFYHPKDANGKVNTSKRNPLPGFTHIDDLCLVTTEKPLAQQDTEEKVINVYDPEARKELPKNMPMLVDLIGKEVTLGVLKQTVPKQTKTDGGYVDSGETRDENVTDKVFHYPSNLTVSEAKNGVTQSAFYDAWLQKNKGVTRDKTKKSDTAAVKTGRPGLPPQATGAGASKPASLFGAR